MIDRQQPYNCPSCGKDLTQNYCANCGERKLVSKLRSIKYIVGDVIEDFISVDSKLWRTLGLLFSKPGQLDYNYHIGKRINYLKPVALFFIINVIFVMFSPLTDFYVSLDDQLHLQPYSSFINEKLNQFISSHNIDYAMFENNYNQLVKVLSRTLIILQVPIFMVFVSLIFYKKSHYLSDHFIFSLNAHSWLLSWIVLLALFLGMIELLIKLFSDTYSVDGLYFILLNIGFVSYPIMAAKKMYEHSWLKTILLTIVLLPAFMLSHMIFRFLQFIITIIVI